MKHTVLLVEDEEELRDLMCDALQRAGYTVVAAREGHDALDALVGIEHVCLVLLDLMMPGMDGWDFFKAFRANPAFASVPVIIHSSSPSRAPEGATQVLQKPMKLEGLLAIVREYCAADVAHV